MLLHPGLLLTVILNFLYWAMVSLGTAWLGSSYDRERINIDHPLFSQRNWEKNGSTYERLLNVRMWKDHLPDWGGMFAGGFSKKRLESGSSQYLERFVAESCRGEAIHWIVMFFGPVSLLWNPLWAAAIMTAYGVAANLPCIIVQRYNRIRLRRLLRGRRGNEL